VLPVASPSVTVPFKVRPPVTVTELPPESCQSPSTVTPSSVLPVNAAARLDGDSSAGQRATE